MNDAIRAEFEANPEYYKQKTNKETLYKAASIFAQGIDKAESTLRQALADSQVNGKKFPPEMVPLSRMVANELARNGRVDSARDIISGVAAELSEAGLLGQAARILRNADPITAQAAIQKEIDKINEQINKRYGNKLKWKAELTAEEIERINQTDFSQDGAFESLYNDIGARLGKEMPSTALEKWREIRKVGMLANPKTQIKNGVANVPLALERKAAERLSGAIQSLAVETGLMSEESQTRTATVGKEYKDVAESVYKEFKDRILGNSSKGELKGVLAKERTYFSDEWFLGKAMNATRKATYDALSLGDSPFVKSAFIDSLAECCSAKGISSVDAVSDAAIEYAMQQADLATFKANNAVVEAINSLKQKGAAGEALDILFPFTTTPINIAEQMLEYSPIGFLTGFVKAYNGKSGAEIADAFSRAIVGTTAIGLGFLFRNIGWITGAEDKDKEKAAFDKANGISPYSIMGKWSYEWAQPADSQMAIGAEIADAIENDTELQTAIFDGVIAAGDSFFANTFFSSILDRFGGNSESPTENLINTLAESSVSQTFPSLIGATARVLDDTVRSTYSDNGTIGRILNQNQAKLTFKSDDLPASINARGEEVKRGNLLERVLDNYIFPWNTNRNNPTVDDALISEIYRETNRSDIFPPTTVSYVKYSDDDGVEHKLVMTPEERETYSKTQGQTYYSAISTIKNSPEFRSMTAGEQADLLSEFAKYSKAVAKREYLSGRGIERIDDTLDAAKYEGLSGVGLYKYMAIEAAYKSRLKADNYKSLDSLLDSLSASESDYAKQFVDENSPVEWLLNAKDNGISSKTYLIGKETQSAYSKANDDTGLGKARGVVSSDLSDDEIDALIGLKKTDVDKNGTKITTYAFSSTNFAKYYDIARNEGLTPSEALDAFVALDKNNDGKISKTEEKKLDSIINSIVEGRATVPLQ